MGRGGEGINLWSCSDTSHHDLLGPTSRFQVTSSTVELHHVLLCGVMCCSV